jgi:hypothetical protein
MPAYKKIGSCEKSIPAIRSKLYFERHVIFEISLSEISKMTCLKREYSAAKGGKLLFSQPHSLMGLPECRTNKPSMCFEV